MIGLIIIVLASAIGGILEGWGFDGRKAFEKKWGVDPLSYFGSKSWKTAYKNNDKTQGYKNLYTRLFGAWDFYHHADKARKYGYILGTLLIGLSWYLLAAILLSMVSKKYSMKWIRHNKN